MTAEALSVLVMRLCQFRVCQLCCARLCAAEMKPLSRVHLLNVRLDHLKEQRDGELCTCWRHSHFVWSFTNHKSFLGIYHFGELGFLTRKEFRFYFFIFL